MCHVGRGGATREVRRPEIHSAGLSPRWRRTKRSHSELCVYDLPNRVQIIARRLMNGRVHPPDFISRTADYIAYSQNQPILALIDVDTKGMPGAVRRRIDAIGGYWSALVSVLPALATAGRAVRNSTSAGLFRTDTHEPLPGSSGLHIYVMLEDGKDVARFLRILHARCWLMASAG